MTEEKWREVVGFTDYEVSNLGRVRSWKKNGTTLLLRSEPKILQHFLRGSGYLSVSLCNPAINKRFVHRLVLEAFVGPCPRGMECRHRDSDKSNNKLSNLVWGTPQENADDRVAVGSMPRGVRHHNVKLSRKEVGEIKERVSLGQPRASVAIEFNISISTIGRIVRGVSWFDD